MWAHGDHVCGRTFSKLWKSLRKQVSCKRPKFVKTVLSASLTHKFVSSTMFPNHAGSANAFQYRGETTEEPRTGHGPSLQPPASGSSREPELDMMVSNVSSGVCKRLLTSPCHGHRTSTWMMQPIQSQQTHQRTLRPFPVLMAPHSLQPFPASPTAACLARALGSGHPLVGRVRFSVLRLGFT